MHSRPEIDGYSDLQEIGRGGFAVVYGARQDAFARDVAVKMLNQVGDADTVRRFTRECEAAGSLSWHPRVVVVHDTGTTSSGNLYLAMEFMAGGSLADRVSGQPMSWQDAVQAGVHVADGLEAAHRSGLLHRDIKPDNVLVDRFGECKLGDFGIAAVQGVNYTSTGTVTATVVHAAPEVLNGERASPLSDIYSLGSTLYELLVGRPAFVTGDDDSLMQILARVATQPVPDARAHGVPDAVCSVVERAMAKDPADRHESAGALGGALQAAQRDAGVPVTPMRHAVPRRQRDNFRRCGSGSSDGGATG